MPGQTLGGDRERGGVEGVPRKQEPLFEGRRPSGANEFQVTAFVGTVDFVADDGISGMREVDADLVHATSLGKGPDEREAAAGGRIERKTALHAEIGRGARSFGMDRLLEVNCGRLVFALAKDRRVHGEGIVRGPSPNQREVLFRDAAGFHLEAEGARRSAVLGHERQPAGLAIEPIDNRNLPAVDDLVSQ